MISVWSNFLYGVVTIRYLSQFMCSVSVVGGDDRNSIQTSVLIIYEILCVILFQISDISDYLIH